MNYVCEICHEDASQDHNFICEDCDASHEQQFDYNPIPEKSIMKQNKAMPIDMDHFTQWLNNNYSLQETMDALSLLELYTNRR
jgi:hypothetical protein